MLTKKVKATTQAIIRVLTEAAPAYAEHLGAKEVKVMSHGTRAKGGYAWLRVSVYDVQSMQRFYFLVRMTHRGHVWDVFPEVRERYSDNTLAFGNKQCISRSHESIAPEVLGDPVKMFGPKP